MVRPDGTIETVAGNGERCFIPRSRQPDRRRRRRRTAAGLRPRRARHQRAHQRGFRPGHRGGRDPLFLRFRTRLRLPHRSRKASCGWSPVFAGTGSGDDGAGRPAIAPPAPRTVGRATEAELRGPRCDRHHQRRHPLHRRLLRPQPGHPRRPAQPGLPCRISASSRWASSTTSRPAPTASSTCWTTPATSCGSDGDGALDLGRRLRRPGRRRRPAGGRILFLQRQARSPTAATSASTSSKMGFASAASTATARCTRWPDPGRSAAAATKMASPRPAASFSTTVSWRWPASPPAPMAEPTWQTPGGIRCSAGELAYPELLRANELLIADGGQVFVFDRRGRHLRTRHAVTGATLYEFGYDRRGPAWSRSRMAAATPPRSKGMRSGQGHRHRLALRATHRGFLWTGAAGSPEVENPRTTRASDVHLPPRPRWREGGRRGALPQDLRIQRSRPPRSAPATKSRKRRSDPDRPLRPGLRTTR